MLANVYVFEGNGSLITISLPFKYELLQASCSFGVMNVCGMLSYFRDPSMWLCLLNVKNIALASCGCQEKMFEVGTFSLFKT